MYYTGTGQWMQEDPIQFDAGDPNLRRYVGNNATNETDPTGLQKKEEAKKYEYGGPDVTEWFFEEIRIFRKYAHGKDEEMRRIGGAIDVPGGPFSVPNAVLLSDFGNRLTDYKARFDKDPAMEGAQRWPFKNGYNVQVAGNYNPNTVTFCGQVIPINQLGNIMFGIIAEDLHYATWARLYGQGKTKLGPLTGPKEPWLVPDVGPPRAAAFELGVKYAQKVPWDQTNRELMKGYVTRGFRAPFEKDGQRVEKNRARITDRTPPGLLPSKAVYHGPQTDILDHKAWGLLPSGEIKEDVRKKYIDGQ